MEQQRKAKKIVKLFFILLTFSLLISCSNEENNAILDAGFNVSDGFYNVPEKSRNGTNGKIVFINNPLDFGDKDSVFVYFNNFIIIKNTFKEVNDIVIPTNIKGKDIQTAMLVKHNGIKYFYVYEGYDLFLPPDFDSKKPIYFVFTPKNYSKVPYEVYVK